MRRLGLFLKRAPLRLPAYLPLLILGVLTGFFAFSHYMDFTVYETISFIEVLAVASTLMGFLMAAYNTLDAQQDHDAAKHPPDGLASDERDMIVARGNRRTELVYALVQLMILALAIYAMTSPAPVRPQLVTFSRLVLIYPIMGGTCLLAYLSVTNRYDRHALSKMKPLYPLITRCRSAAPDCAFKQLREEKEKGV